MLQWFNNNGDLVRRLGGFSLLTFFGTVVLIPVFVSRLPADYFTHPRRLHDYTRDRHPAFHHLGIALKNVLGVMLVGAGMVMLVLPGQGILTILIGVMLTDFPGKYALEKRLVSRPTVMRTLNWMRAKANRPPFHSPDILVATLRANLRSSAEHR